MKNHVVRIAISGPDLDDVSDVLEHIVERVRKMYVSGVDRTNSNGSSDSGCEYVLEATLAGERTFLIEPELRRLAELRQ